MHDLGRKRGKMLGVIWPELEGWNGLESEGA